ncbi:MAG: serine/threonine protein kinase [Oscillatoriales cyanobacterium SM2_1_8]|nr:serine/threonine protein kinase [Oscillatoriales cyanobacterium SM2_1_8]
MNPQQLWRQLETQIIADKYILEKVVGAGSFGGVFQGQWQEQGKTLRRIAVKLMPVPEDKAEEERSFQELQLAVQLDHPHIVRCFDVGRCLLTGGNYFYLVMELGTESLQQRLNRRLLDAEELQSLCEHIAKALDYLHNPDSALQAHLPQGRPIQALVHRDLKPGNIIQVGDRWKLCDLGIARAIRRDDYNTTRPMMTLAYASPEAFEGIVSPAGDIWALGITLVVAGTNRFPFPDAGTKKQLGTTSQLIENIRQYRLQLPKLPEPIAEIVGSCLKKERTARWTASQILQRLQGTAPTVPLSPLPPQQTAMVVGDGVGSRLVGRSRALDRPMAGSP